MPARDCVGAARCPYGAECFAEASRARAREADIVVTNHSLLAVDMLAERHIVPPHKLLVVDEAHELADRVSSAAQAELTPEAVERAAKRARPLITPAAAESLAEAADALTVGLADAPAGRLTTGLPPLLAQAVILLDSATRAALEAIGDIKNDDPDPVRKQQAKATLDDLSDDGPAAARGVRLRRGLGREVRPGQRPPRPGGRAAVGGRHPGRPPVRGPHGGGHLGDADAGRPVRHGGPLARPAGRCPPSAAGPAHRRRGPRSPATAGARSTSARRSTTPSRASCTSPRTCPARPRPGCPTPAGEELLKLVTALGGRTLGLFSSRKAAHAGRRAAPRPHRPAGAAAGRGVAAAAGPQVPRRPGELPVRRDVAVAGRRRARRRLPAGGHRPAAVPPPRRAAGRGPRGGGGRGRRVRLRRRSACRSPRSGWPRASAG